MIARLRRNPDAFRGIKRAWCGRVVVRIELSCPEETCLRRLVAICALAAIPIALFFTQFPLSGGTTQTPLVVADNIAARALAISPIDSRPSVYFTNAASPNRIFTLIPITDGSNGAASLNRPVTVLAGTGAAGSLGDGGMAVAAQFDLSQDSLIKRSGIAVAPDGTIYVADTQNSTIRTIAANTSTEPDVIRSIAGRWAPRQNTALAEPLGIAFDRAGNLYIADHAAGAVDVLRAATGQIEILAHVVSPASIAVTPHGGKVFVASPDTGGVFAIDTQTRAIEIVPGFSAPGASGGSSASLKSEVTDASATSIACRELKSGMAASATNQQVCPAGLAVDGGANLFIADANSGRILRVDAQTNNNTVAAKGLSAPGAIAFNARGDLYVAEQGRNRIVELQQAGLAQSSISLSPASAGFINAVVPGRPTTAFSLANNSASAATGVVISIAGANPADFTVVNTNCGATLNASSTCTIGVDLSPQASGARSATLTVTDSNPNDLATANLYTLGLSPSSASFPTEPVGGTTPTQQFTLSNGSPGVTITGLSVAMNGVNLADFVVEGKSCTTTLAASTACTINVAFTPQNTGSRTAELSITEPGGAFTSANLSGTGDDFQLQLASGQTSEVSVKAGGTATFNAQVVPIGPFGASGEKVSFVCPSNLPANTTCRFSPNSASVTPGTPAPFKIILATTNRAGTTAALGAPRILPGLGGSFPRGPLGLLSSAAGTTQLAARARLFPSLAALAIFAGVLAFRRRGRGLIHLLLVVLLLAGVLAGCHKKSTANSLATPTGTSVMTIESNAVDAAGRSLNAGRSLTITLDVTQ
jgi:sugar lactone lactonase YvrE